MNESKLALTERLRDENRFDEAMRFKDAFIQDCRDQGMRKVEAAEAAWNELERNFPPLTEETGADQAIDVSIPPSWGELPTEASYSEEIQWVYRNFAFIVEKVPGGQSKLHLDDAFDPAPSHGAIGLLQWAMKNETAFYKDVYPKVILRSETGGDDGDEQKAKVENEESPGDSPDIGFAVGGGWLTKTSCVASDAPECVLAILGD